MPMPWYFFEKMFIVVFLVSDMFDKVKMKHCCCLAFFRDKKGGQTKSTVNRRKAELGGGLLLYISVDVFLCYFGI